MYEWSEMERAIQDAVRQFVDAEVRPHREELEFGDLPPYDILRKLWKTFGIGVMAADSIAKLLAKERAAAEAPATETPQQTGADRPRGGMGGALGGQAGMGVILIKELCRVSPGFVGAFGVSLGLGASTIMSRGTLAQKERWLPGLVTLEKIGA